MMMLGRHCSKLLPGLHYSESMFGRIPWRYCSGQLLGHYCPGQLLGRNNSGQR
jgi:hypothetical protein